MSLSFAKGEAITGRRLFFPAVCCLLSLFAAACDKGSPVNATQGAKTPEVTCVAVATRPVDVALELEGRVRAFQVSDVRPQVNGILQSRLFEEGDDVKAGDVLYQIDPKIYQADLASAEAALARAKAQLPSAKLRLERHRQLVRENAVSRQDSDDVEAAWKQAVAEVAVAEAAVDTARIRLGYTSVRSPITGRTGRSMLTPGALMTANQPDLLTTVTQLDPVYVDVTQSSKMLLELEQAFREGRLLRSGEKSANVRLVLENGSRYEHEGELTFTGTNVDERTGSVTLRAVFPNPERRLLPGMYVRAKLVAGRNSQATLIPQPSVMRDTRGNAYVFVVGKGNVLASREVHLGQTAGDEWIVQDGLEKGELVVLEGLQMVRPGMKVVVHEKPAGKTPSEAARNGKGA